MVGLTWNWGACTFLELYLLTSWILDVQLWGAMERQRVGRLHPAYRNSEVKPEFKKPFWSNKDGLYDYLSQPPGIKYCIYFVEYVPVMPTHMAVTCSWPPQPDFSKGGPWTPVIALIMVTLGAADSQTKAYYVKVVQVDKFWTKIYVVQWL